MQKKKAKTSKMQKKPGPRQNRTAAYHNLVVVSSCYYSKGNEPEAAIVPLNYGALCGTEQVFWVYKLSSAFSILICIESGVVVHTPPHRTPTCHQCLLRFHFRLCCCCCCSARRPRARSASSATPPTLHRPASKASSLSTIGDFSYFFLFIFLLLFVFLILFVYFSRLCTLSAHT